MDEPLIFPLHEDPPASPASREVKRDDRVIGIVGPCSSGKTTLIHGLSERGIQARHIAQDHSFVPDMWQRISHPDILIYLDVSFEVSQKRRFLDWQEDEFKQQLVKLAHARQHANLVIQTDRLSVSEVLEQVLAYLKKE